MKSDFTFLLEPPPPHLLALLTSAAQHQALADAFADGFNTPVDTWELLRSPQALAALLDAFGAHVSGPPRRPRTVKETAAQRSLVERLKEPTQTPP